MFFKGIKNRLIKKTRHPVRQKSFSFPFYPHSSLTKLEIEFPFLIDKIQENFRKGYVFLRKKKQQKGVYFSAVSFRHMKTSCNAAAKVRAGVVYAAMPPKEIV